MDYNCTNAIKTILKNSLSGAQASIESHTDINDHKKNNSINSYFFSIIVNVLRFIFNIPFPPTQVLINMN